MCLCETWPTYLARTWSWHGAMQSRTHCKEGPMRIQHKCLVPIYVFPEIKLLFPNTLIMFCLPVPTLIYLWDIYIFPGLVCLFCCREICGLILGIYESPQTNECVNWEWVHTIPRKVIHKWDFPCSAQNSVQCIIRASSSSLAFANCRA